MTEVPHLAVDGVAIARGGTEVIADASFHLGAGLWLLQGSNGAGKSTLLRALAGVGPVARGTIAIAGHDIDREPTAARARLGYAPQSAELFGYLGVGELLQTIAGLRGVAADEAIARARAWITADCVDRRIDTLSAGQRRKLYLCAALCGLPTVLLLDEPEAGLDLDAQRELRDELTALGKAGHAVVVASHAEASATVEATGILIVAQGRVRLAQVHPVGLVASTAPP